MKAMKSGGLLALIGVMGVVSVAEAQIALNITVREATSDQTTVNNVTPNSTVNYEIVGRLMPATGHQGLALWGGNLNYDHNGTPFNLPQASAGATMGTFVKNQGVTNPAGYGGTAGATGELLQIGGGQNTIKNTAEFADFPVGPVVTGIAQNADVILATGSVQAPATGSAHLNASQIFANVIEADNGDFWVTKAAQQGTIANLTINVSEPNVIEFDSSYPAADGRLWRSTKHVIRLRFLGNITAPAAGEVQVQKLLAGGTFGPNVADNWTFAVENDQNGQPRVLRIEDPANELENRVWYRVVNTGGWATVEPFDIDLKQCGGDGNNDNFVNSNDLAFCNGRISPTPGVPWSWTDVALQQRYRCNVNADNFVNTLDLSAINGRIQPLACPNTKPTGH